MRHGSDSRAVSGLWGRKLSRGCTFGYNRRTPYYQDLYHSCIVTAIAVTWKERY